MADMGGAMTTDDPAHMSPQELIDRLGPGALEFAKDRIKNLPAEGDTRERDQAYRLLTALENLFDKEA